MSDSTHHAHIWWSDRPVRIEYQWLSPQRTDAPLMVFLHEGLGSAAMWRDFPQRLCDAAQCCGLVYSRPGYGRSTPRAKDEAWDVDFMHRQAHEVLPALFDVLAINPGNNPVWLFGHSDGASIALLYAARHPACVRGMITLAPHVMVEDLCLSSIARARDAYQHADLRSRLARYHDDVDSAFHGWSDIWLQPAFRDWSILDELKTITCPVLAVQGLDDEYGTIEQIRGIARQLPQTKLIELPACGHSPHRDQSDTVIQAVKDFIHRGDPP